MIYMHTGIGLAEEEKAYIHCGIRGKRKERMGSTLFVLHAHIQMQTNTLTHTP